MTNSHNLSDKLENS